MIFSTKKISIPFILHNLTWRSSAAETINGILGWNETQFTPRSCPWKKKRKFSFIKQLCYGSNNKPKIIISYTIYLNLKWNHDLLINSNFKTQLLIKMSFFRYIITTWKFELFMNLDTDLGALWPMLLYNTLSSNKVCPKKMKILGV